MSAFTQCETLCSLFVFYSDWEGVGMGVDIDVVQSADDVGVFFRGFVLEGMWDTDFIMGGRGQ